jgi:hypothetical protein
MLGFNQNGSGKIAPWLRYPIAFYGGFEVFRGVTTIVSVKSTAIPNPIPEELGFLKPLDTELHKAALMITPGFVASGGPDLIVGLASLWAMGFWDPTKLY